MISIAIVTYNRLHLLRQCVTNVLSRVSDETTQIVIWNNCSTDGTREFLNGHTRDGWEIVHHDENIGTNAFARSFARCTGRYLIELDDDIIDAPEHWDRKLREAIDAVPLMGFLAASCVDDGKSVASEILYRRDAHLYTRETIGGANLLVGPTGGWCTITTRAIYDRVGGFVENPKFVFWHEDGEYARRVQDAGYRIALLDDVRVFHASGPAYTDDASIAAAKAEYYGWRDRRRAWRHKVKLLLDRVPGVRALNRRLRLYTIVPTHGGSARDG